MKRYPHYISLIIQKALADLVSETRRGYMGMLWWVIEPVLYMAVFYLIFVEIGHGGKSRVVFLLIGLVAWKWFAVSISQSANSISSNIGLIQQVYIPKLVFPSMVIMTSTMKFFIVFTLLIGFVLGIGNHPSVVWISLPVIIFVQLLMMLAVGGVLASIVPFLPDLRLILDNVMLLLFFLSGIFFEISFVSPELKPYLYINPMVGIIESYRYVLLDGQWPDWMYIGKLSLFSVSGIVLGVYLLRRFDRTYAKVI